MKSLIGEVSDKCGCLIMANLNCRCPPKPKQPGDRYRARRDPDHDGLWVVVDRTLLLNYGSLDSFIYWSMAVVCSPVADDYRFPSITDAIEFIKLLELSDQTNRGIE